MSFNWMTSSPEDEGACNWQNSNMALWFISSILNNNHIRNISNAHAHNRESINVQGYNM